MLLALVFAGAPMAAAALSCMPHSVEAAFVQAQAAEVRFVVVQGQLDFDAGQLPKVDYDNQHDTPAMTLIDGELQGRSLSLAGFVTPYHKRVTIAVSCLGPWCASAQSGDVLAFVEMGAQGHVINTTPCGGYLFTAPTKKMTGAVKSCFSGNAY